MLLTKMFFSVFDLVRRVSGFIVISSLDFTSKIRPRMGNITWFPSWIGYVMSLGGCILLYAIEFIQFMPPKRGKDQRLS